MSVDGLCGDPTCEARVDAALDLPGDRLVRAPCDRCATAVVAAITAEQSGLLR